VPEERVALAVDGWMSMWLLEFFMTIPRIPESEMRRLEPLPMMKGGGVLV